MKIKEKLFKSTIFIGVIFLFLTIPKALENTEKQIIIDDLVNTNEVFTEKRNYFMYGDLDYINDFYYQQEIPVDIISKGEDEFIYLSFNKNCIYSNEFPPDYADDYFITISTNNGDIHIKSDYSDGNFLLQTNEYFNVFKESSNGDLLCSFNLKALPKGTLIEKISLRTFMSFVTSDMMRTFILDEIKDNDLDLSNKYNEDITQKMEYLVNVPESYYLGEVDLALNFNVYMPSELTKDNFGYCYLEDVWLDDENKVTISVINTCKGDLTEARINGQLYGLTKIDKFTYTINNLHPILGQDAVYNIDYIFFDDYYTGLNGTRQSFTSSCEINQNFNLTSQIIYHTMVPMQFTQEMEYVYPGIKKNLKYESTYFALFDNVNGRIKNATKVRINGEKYTNKKKSDTLKFTNIYDISQPGNNDDKTFADNICNADFGFVRKLNDDQRYQVNLTGFNKLEKILLDIQNIKVAGIYYDYQYGIGTNYGKGFGLKETPNIVEVEYYTEANQIYFASAYPNALHWDSEGNVYTGQGEITEYTFNGNEIVDKFGNVVQPNKIDMTQKAPTIMDTLADAVKSAKFPSLLKDKSLKGFVSTILGVSGICVVAYIGIKFYKFIKK